MSRMRERAEYRIWCGIKYRCNNKQGKSYGNYGGRGIKVCPQWNNDFNEFYRYVGNRPSEKHSLDRIDNDRGYEPGNVRWATRQVQNRNSRVLRILEYQGERKCLAEWSELFGISYGTLHYRIRSGWPISKAFLTPLYPNHGRGK